jgi:hypothetical protein
MPGVQSSPDRATERDTVASADVAFVGDDRAHDILSCKRPALGRRAQFQLWIFSYTNLPVRSKKRLSRLMIGFGAIAPDFAALHPGDDTYRPAASFS